MVVAPNHGDRKAPVVLELVAGLHLFGVAVAPFSDRNRRDYSYSMPKKVRKLALKMAMSARNQEGNLVIVDSFDLSEIKTKDFVGSNEKFPV